MEPFTDSSESKTVSMPEDVMIFLTDQANQAKDKEERDISEDDIDGRFYREEKGFGYGVIAITQGEGEVPNYFGAKYRIEDNKEEKNIKAVTFGTVIDEILESHHLEEARKKKVSATILEREGIVVRVNPDPIKKYKDHYIVIPNKNSDIEEKKIYSTPVRAKQIK